MSFARRCSLLLRRLTREERYAGPSPTPFIPLLLVRELIKLDGGRKGTTPSQPT